MSEAVLHLILQTKTSLNALNAFCSSSKGAMFCNKNKEMVCKKALKISGYKTTPTVSSCEIYGELSQLVKKLPENAPRTGKATKSVIAMDPTLLELARKKASSKLRAFLVFNKISIPLEEVSNVKRAKSIAIGLAKNPLVRKQVQSLFGL